MFDEIGGEGVAKSGRVEVAGCLEMNDFEINFLDTQADEGWNWHFRVARGGRGTPWIMEDVCQNFWNTQRSLIGYVTKRGKESVIVYTRLPNSPLSSRYESFPFFVDDWIIWILFPFFQGLIKISPIFKKSFVVGGWKWKRKNRRIFINLLDPIFPVNRVETWRSIRQNKPCRLRLASSARCSLGERNSKQVDGSIESSCASSVRSWLDRYRRET